MTFPGTRVRFRLLALAGLLASALTVIVAPTARPAGAVAATPPVLPVCPVPSSPAEWYPAAAAKGPAVMLTPASAGSYIGADVVRGLRTDCAWQASQQSTYHIDPAVYGTNVTYSYAAVASAVLSA